MTDEEGYSAELESKFNKLVKKVNEDIMSLGFNTAIAAMMSLINDIYAKGSITRGEMRTFLLVLSPFAPHITEEMWQMLGFEGMASVAMWPTYDESKCVDDVVEIPVQVNGKLRGKITVSKSAEKDEIIKLAKDEPNVKSNIRGKTVVKEIFVPGKMVNIVVR